MHLALQVTNAVQHTGLHYTALLIGRLCKDTEPNTQAQHEECNNCMLHAWHSVRGIVNTACTCLPPCHGWSAQQHISQSTWGTQPDTRNTVMVTLLCNWSLKYRKPQPHK